MGNRTEQSQRDVFGNEKFKLKMQMPKKRRKSHELSVGNESFPDTRVTVANLRKARTLPCFCNTIDQLQTHFQEMKNMSNLSLCEARVCGKCTFPFFIYSNRCWNGAK